MLIRQAVEPFEDDVFSLKRGYARLMTCIFFHLDSVGRVCHFPHYFPPRRSVYHEYHRGAGYCLAREAETIRFECSTPLQQKTACRAAFRHACTLVEDIRTAVQEQSDFLAPVQQLLDRVSQEKDRDQALQLAV